MEEIDRAKDENIKAQSLIQDVEKAEEVLKIVKEQIKNIPSSLQIHKSLKGEVERCMQ